MENASKALIIAGAILIAILLISIGIILINSGRDVTSTGTAGMNSQKIQTFNSQFTAYEGKRKWSEIKSRYNTVNASNATDSEHQVEITVKTSETELTSTKIYTVTINYSATGKEKPNGNGNTEKGYIYSINISES